MYLFKMCKEALPSPILTLLLLLLLLDSQYRLHSFW